MTAARINSIFALGSGYLVRTVAQTVLGLLIARILHVDDFAIVRIISAYWLIMMMCGRLSMYAAVVGLGSGTNEPDDQRAYAATATGVTLAASLLVIVVIECFAYFTDFLPPAIESALIVVTFALPFACLSEVFVGSLQARGKFILAGQVSVLYGLVPLVLITLTTWRFDFEGWIVGKILADLVIFAVMLYLCYDWVNLKFWCREKLRLLLGFAKVNFFSGVFSVVIATIDILILSQLADDLSELGCYGLAILIFRAAGFAPQAVARVFVREIALASVRADRLSALISLSLRNCLLVGIAVAAGFVAVLPFVVTTFLSSEYAPAGSYTVWLAPGFILYSLYLSSQEVFIALRKPELALIVHSIGLAFLVGMLLVLTPVYGALGVVWAVSLDYLLMVVLGLYLLLPWLRGRGGSRLAEAQ